MEGFGSTAFYIGTCSEKSVNEEMDHFNFLLGYPETFYWTLLSRSPRLLFSGGRGIPSIEAHSGQTLMSPQLLQPLRRTAAFVTRSASGPYGGPWWPGSPHQLLGKSTLSLVQTGRLHLTPRWVSSAMIFRWKWQFHTEHNRIPQQSYIRFHNFRDARINCIFQQFSVFVTI